MTRSHLAVWISGNVTGVFLGWLAATTGWLLAGIVALAWLAALAALAASTTRRRHRGAADLQR